jgi:hypothetical protein
LTIHPSYENISCCEKLGSPIELEISKKKEGKTAVVNSLQRKRKVWKNSGLDESFSLTMNMTLVLSGWATRSDTHAVSTVIR